MADAGSLKITVDVESTRAERDLRNLERQTEKVQRQTQRATRSNQQFSQYSAARHQDPSGGMGVGTTAAGAAAFRSGQTASARAAAGSRLSRLGGVLRGAGGPAAIGVTVAMAIVNFVKKISEESTRQSSMMATQLQTSMRTRQSLERLTALDSMAADPFGRGMAFHRARNAALGAVPSRAQARVLASGADFQNLLERQREVNRGTVAEIVTPYQNIDRGARMLGRRAIGSFLSSQADLANEGGTMAQEQARERLRRSNYTSAVGLVRNAEAAIRRQLNRITGAEDAAAAGARARQQTLDRFTRLNRLERLGPDAATGAAPGFRAGSAEEYAFRVNQQVQERRLEATEKWQNEILAAVREMVRQGEQDPDSLLAREMEFGRTPIARPARVE